MLHYCPHCRRPIWDTLSVDTTTNLDPSAYCQCLSISIHLTDYAYQALKSLSRQLAPQPQRVKVPRVYYEALSDEEVSL